MRSGRCAGKKHAHIKLGHFIGEHSAGRCPELRELMAVLRSRNDRVIAGVCGGFAKALGWNSTAVRIIYVVGSILSAAFPGILVYFVLWAVMPQE